MSPTVDTSHGASVSFRPPDAALPAPQETATSARGSGTAHGARVAVGPGRPGPSLSSRPGIRAVSSLPVHVAKIQRPSLRDDVLSRSRLNHWLDAHAERRLVLVVGEAGYGKTTLLADWSRSTTRRTLWYRLDSDDRDWLAFIRHLVVAARQVDEAFGPETIGLLGELGPGGPTRDQVVASFIRELSQFAAGGLSVILDDFHQVEGSDEIPALVRAILDRSGDGLSLLIASRRAPRLALARVRSHGGLANLGERDLRFDRGETERLFRDAYQHPLEPDVVAELSARTDGWAASLRLVRTAIEERSPAEIRSFVGHLSGARGDLHDFLAEEVVGHLDPELQRFLMLTSILEIVEPQAASVVDPAAAPALTGLIERADELGLLQRSGDEDPQYRFHPLVRDFLQARLEADIGKDAIRALHLELGRRFEGKEWRTSATHYSQGGDHVSVERVIESAVDEIFAAGRFNDVLPFLDLLSDPPDRPLGLILRSRLEMTHGAMSDALRLAGAAVGASSPSHPRLGLALLNLASLKATAGVRQDVVELVHQALREPLTPHQREIADASVAAWESSKDGDLRVLVRRYSELARRQTSSGSRRYAAITRLNLSSALYWLGDAEGALREAEGAEIGFVATADLTSLAAAIAAKSRAYAHLGRMAEARRSIDEPRVSHNPIARFELMLEGAQILNWYGSGETARWMLTAAGAPEGLLEPFAGPWILTAAEVALRNGRLDDANLLVAQLDDDTLSADTGALLRRRLLEARLSAARGEPDAGTRLHAAEALARKQGSGLGQQLTQLLISAQATAGDLDASVSRLAITETAVISLAAEELVGRLHWLGADAWLRVKTEVTSRPDRWLACVRAAVTAGGDATERAAALLVLMGDISDVALLQRSASRSAPLRTAAESLVRHLAPPVHVSDLGHVTVVVGSPPVARENVRRKVLSLLCFLISRGDWVAAKEEVLEALWPDLSPETATNSLNQTIYYLRRVFESPYREEMSPGYLRFQGETIGLDHGLITSTSQICRRLAASYMRTPREADLDALLAKYSARFGLDFAYEEWAGHYRDGLHAAVIGALEVGIDRAAERGDFRRAIFVAQRVLEIDPDTDAVELKLVSLYRRTGATAAAAEQYTHYSAQLRDQLGVEPPPLDTL
jgi:ATP/maltotriose-dependent transcriptional regulator MalT/DNA-binding SARP family transcriptional activator